MKLRLLGAVTAIALIGGAASALAGYGQTQPNDPNKLKANLTGAAERPGPGDPNGSGRALVTLRQRARRVCFNITFRRIGRPVAAHIHKGGRRVAGDIEVLFFERPNGASSPVRGCANRVARRLIRDIRERPGRFYVNLHTRSYPNGAIRGQLKRR
jgi:hypothetical protein